MEFAARNGGGLQSWKDLKVWHLAHQLVLRVYSITQKFPREERFRLCDQLCRASASIPTNIAEGKGRASTKEYINFLSSSRGSVEEVKYLLLLSKDLGYIQTSVFEEMTADYDQVGRMLNGLMSALRQKL